MKINKHIVSSYDRELSDLKEFVIKIFNILFKQIDDVHSCVINHDKHKADMVISKNKQINILNKEIIDLCLKILSLRSPVATDLRFVFACSHISRNLERISDNTRNIAKQIKTIKEGSKTVENKILEMIHTISVMLHNTQEAFNNSNSYSDHDHSLHMVKEIIEKDIEIDNSYDEVVNTALNRKSLEQNAEALKVYFLIARYVERLGDHLVNVAHHIDFIITGKLNT